jgi:hypothetical protein
MSEPCLPVALSESSLSIVFASGAFDARRTLIKPSVDAGGYGSLLEMGKGS